MTVLYPCLTPVCGGTCVAGWMTCDGEETLVTQKHAVLRYWRDRRNWSNAKTALFALLACPAALSAKGVVVSC